MEEKEVSIRHAVAEDAEPYRELRLEALKNHPDAFGMDYEVVLSRPEEYWTNTLTINPEEKALYFAFAGEKLIGMTGIYKNMGKKARHSANVWGVYVRKGWRGKRISEVLLRSCLGWAREQGLSIVKLAVVTSNTSALKTYERCGFSIYGIEPKAIFHDGKYYDEYLMSLELTDTGR